VLAGLAATSAGGAAGDVVWSYLTEGIVYSSPAVANDGTVYVGSSDPLLNQGWVYAINQDGTLKWRFDNVGDWVDSSPAIGADGTVYVGCWDFRLYALDGQTGVQKWSFETGGMIIAAPAIATDGTIYVGSNDGIFYALNPDGSLKWFHVGEFEIDSSAAIGADGRIYYGNDGGQLTCLWPDGSLYGVWQVTASTAGADIAINSSPAITEEGDVLFGCRDGVLYSLDQNLNLNWTYAAAESIDSSPAVDALGRVYFGSHDGYLYCLGSDGLQLWEALVGDIFYASPAVDATGVVYVGAYAGAGFSHFTALGPLGFSLWSVSVPGYNDSSPVIDAAGNLYVGMHDQRLYRITPSGLPPNGNQPWPMFRQNRLHTARAIGQVYLTEMQRMFPEAESVTGDWYRVDWFGDNWMWAGLYPWVWHEGYGWVWLGGPGNGALWFWMPDAGWLSRTDQTGDFQWSVASGDWTYLLPGLSATADGVWIFDCAAGSWSHAAW